MRPLVSTWLPWLLVGSLSIALGLAGGWVASITPESGLFDQDHPCLPDEMAFRVTAATRFSIDGTRCVRVTPRDDDDLSPASSTLQCSNQLDWVGQEQSPSGLVRHRGRGWLYPSDQATIAAVAEVFGQGGLAAEHDDVALEITLLAGTWQRPARLRVTRMWEEEWQLILGLPSPHKAGTS